MVKIAVVGAGINGLACAVKIKEKYNNAQGLCGLGWNRLYLEGGIDPSPGFTGRMTAWRHGGGCVVALIADKFSPYTTGDGSGGLWYPYLCGDTPQELLNKWGIESYNFLHQLWLEGGHDICFLPAYSLYRDEANYQEPGWAKNVYGYHKLTDKELKYLNNLFSYPYATGKTFLTFVICPPPFLAYLYQRFKKARGELIKAKVNSLRDPILQDYDVIINCTGLNARFIVGDKAVFPYRGQITKVRAPWVNITVQDEDSGNYIIPNVQLCVLGGTHQENDYNTTLYEEDTHFIMNECKRIMPCLESAMIHSQWVGLRPGRNTVRVEAEMLDGRLTIHNYGHGGCGLTLFWGCASNVLELLETNLKNIRTCETSKL